MKKLIIGVHPNEGMPRQPNPHVPLTATEIAGDAADCVAAGASVMHYHARTSDGAQDYRSAAYATIAAEVRERCDILLAPSMANGPGYTVDQRMSHLVETASDRRTRSDFLVMDMGCANMDLFDPTSASYTSTGRTLANDTTTQQQLLAAARQLAMTPYVATFNVSWTRTLAAHLAAGAIDTPLVVAIILGGPEFVAAHPATIQGLQAQLDFLPNATNLEWIVSAHRGNVLAVAAAAIERGGHVAIGVGDYHYRELGLPTNAQLVARIADLARSLGREIASPDDARRMLGMTRPTPTLEPAIEPRLTALGSRDGRDPARADR